MPYAVIRSDACPVSKPFAVVKQGETRPRGCHPSKEHAMTQVAALYANEGKAAVSSADLPDSAFAYIQPGCQKVNGKTEDRCRHFPIHDAAHVRNALARLSQSPFGPKARAAVEAAARKMGIGEPAGKALFDMKAESLTAKKLDRWLAGDISRRVLVIPFGGPLPGGKAGLDLDGEYFDEDTDIYGPFPGLKASRWRVMDWHHDDKGVPGPKEGGPPSLKGTTVGEIELDEDAEEDGRWANWWIRQGRARRELIAARRIALLERMGEPIYGSSAAIFKQKAADGHIDVWPVYMHTATTTPQNTYAVVPPLKGLLDDIYPDDLTGDAIKALLVGLSELVPDLRETLADEAANTLLADGDPAAKSGKVLATSKEQRLRDALNAAFERLVAELDEIVGLAPQQENP